jgi:CheY-like chemotaxis protein
MHIIICSKRPAIVDAAALAFQSRPAEAGSPPGSDRVRLTVCESGLEVLGAVEVVDADLLLLDMQTPGLNGSLIISAIRELAPSLPILAVSAKPEEDTRALSHQGVSLAGLASGPKGDVGALAAALAQFGDAGGIAASSDAQAAPACLEAGRATY